MGINNKDAIIIIGAGGHAKVVVSTLLAAGKTILGFADDNIDLKGKCVLGYPILGSLESLDLTAHQSAIIAIGSNQKRQLIAHQYPHLNWISAIHPNAYVHESVHIGAGSVIFAGSVIQPDTIIGQHVIINTSATVDHDGRIENYVHIAPGTHLAGNVHIKQGSFLGIGCSVIPNITIGEWTSIGAGSVIVKSIPDFVKAKGVPANIYKKVEKNEIEIN